MYYKRVLMHYNWSCDVLLIVVNKWSENLKKGVKKE